MRSHADIEEEIRRLEKGDLGSLRRAWQTQHRKAFPEHLPRALIVGMIAWQLQAGRFGGLSKEEEKYLADVGRRPQGAPVDRYGKQEGHHQVGTVFVREHEGIVHRVVRITDGFEWQGQKYSSLSAVASAITGTNWNGLRFFGVLAAPQERKRRARA